MKRRIALLSTMLTLGLLSGCSNKLDLPLGISTTEEVYGFQAITAVNLLSSPSSKVAYSPKKSANTEQFNDILYYYEFAENFLNETSPIKFTKKSSDNENYQILYEIITTDLDGNKNEYFMYYNETLLKDDDFDEKEYSIKGEIIFNNESYMLFGEKESEYNEEEISLTVKINDNHFVTVEQEKENKEIEYQYTISKDRQTTSFSLEIEEKRSGTEIKFTKEINDHENEFIYKIIEDKSNYKKIKVVVKENDRFILEQYIIVTYDNDGNPLYTLE